MVLKQSQMWASIGESGLRRMLIGSTLAILAASAMSGSASAKEIIPDPGIQTLGGVIPAQLPVAQALSSKFLFMANEGNEQDDDTVDNGLDETQPVGNPDPNQNPGDNGPAPQAGEVPEPGVLGLFGAGLVALGLFRRRLG